MFERRRTPRISLRLAGTTSVTSNECNSLEFVNALIIDGVS